MAATRLSVAQSPVARRSNRSAADRECSRNRRCRDATPFDGMPIPFLGHLSQTRTPSRGLDHLPDDKVLALGFEKRKLYSTES